jgi:hypothetical protein
VWQENKSLKVAPPTVRPEGIYLRFKSDEDYAWVRVGYSGLETSFDIFPAYAPTPPVAKTSLYVFRFRPPRDWPVEAKAKRWVLWDVVRKRVSLTEQVHDFCLVRIVKPRGNADPGTFHIVLEERPQDGPSGGMGQLWELRLQASELLDEDIALGEMDTPEVSFAKEKGGKKANVSFNPPSKSTSRTNADSKILAAISLVQCLLFPP